MQNSMVLVTYSVLSWKLFLGKFGPKSEDCKLKLKYGIWSNWNMQNPIILLTFSVLYQKHPFSENLVQSIKVVSLS